MTEQSQPPEAEQSEAPTGSWEAVPAGDASAPVAPPVPVADAPTETQIEPQPEPAPLATEIVDPPLTMPPPSPTASAAPDRPEVAIGGAFAGGLVAALILKRLAR